MSKINEALKKTIDARNEGTTTVPKKALGKGLAALIGDRGAQSYQKPVPLFAKSSVGKSTDVQYLNTQQLRVSKLQPRHNFDDQKLEELVASIKAKGVLQPILVREREGMYEIIAGERRVRACLSLGITKIPALVKEVTDEDALIISLTENIQRQELNPIEEAKAFDQLLANFGVTQDEMARIFGKNKTTISNTLRLLKLPARIQTYVISGDLTTGHAKALLGISDQSRMEKIGKHAVSKSLSVRELENIIGRTSVRKKTRDNESSVSDPYVLNIERQLQVTLGTKVRIFAQRKRGKIVIEYYSPSDLERIVNVIKK